ncbi:MAG: CBS domain-containing protein [Pseudomonadota bacterium]
MPSSYQAPMRGDKNRKSTTSQSTGTNISLESTTVERILSQKGDAVFSLVPDETLRTAVETLRDKRIGALLVVDSDGLLVGIISERDIVRKLAETPGKTLPQRVSDVMTRKVETCSPDDSLVDVLRRMTNGRFRHMPVMRGDTLVGMVTIGDVINYRLTELEHEALQLKQLIVG